MKKIARFLYLKIRKLNIPIGGGTGVEADLCLLHPDEHLDTVRTSYYERKFTFVLWILIFGFLFGFAAKINSKMESIIPDGIVEREEPGGDVREIRIKADDNKQENIYVVDVLPKQLSEEETQTLSQQFFGQLGDLILGENDSFQSVSSDLRLEESYSGYPFRVEWESSDENLLDFSGMVAEVEKEAPVRLGIELQYEDRRYESFIDILIVPKSRTKEQLEYLDMKQLLLKSEERDRQSLQWEIPDEYNNQPLNWSYVVKDYSLYIWLITPCLGLLIYWALDRDLHSQLIKKRKSLQHDYPDIIHKLVLYVGSGMTVRNAFHKLGMDYEMKKGKQKEGYEEVLYVCRELQAGISEGMAYENMGKRTGERNYIRLGVLLSQNLKRGNKVILSQLTSEADKTLTTTILEIRKLSGEAETKLLIPMLILLGLTMVLILIPAFKFY